MQSTDHVDRREGALDAYGFELANRKRAFWAGEPDAVHPAWLNDHGVRGDRSSRTRQVCEKQSPEVHRQRGDDEKREYSSSVMRDKERVENARHDDDKQQSEDASQNDCDGAARVEFKGQRNGHDSRV